MGNSLRLAVLQPSYLPWLGYLDQIARSDVFAFYDDVQFDKNGWRNRNRIRSAGAEGWSWLTIPVHLGDHFPPIDQVRIDTRVPWRKKHEKTLRLEYAKAAHREVLDGYFGDFFAGESDNLANVAIASIQALLSAFAISTPLYRSSELNVEGDRNSRLLNLCRHFGATTYLSGLAAQDYLDVGLFERDGIAVEFQHFAHPAYAQTREPFVSHLSAIDALLNLGPSAAAELLR